ncbi:MULTISPECIES: hypothetical protein [Bacillus cereus group]|uniref:hypothetical protein n=1 Tax=Bacillus cereus group TaxID=86661 RepID=UPI000772C0C2|nr:MULTISPECIES: hypothetical protein [Bacillus cereus group]KXI47437.1 hypothetical protein ACS95_17525 [Bacillus cereus]MDA2768582.1 hypothetical protein [Bacillus cereus group sp. Bc010]MED1447497.1 hypothetical protein [Bacillus pacificus]
MQKMLFSFLCIFCFVIGSTFTVHAFSPKHLPISQTSDRWKIEIKQPEKKTGLVTSKKDVFDTYGFEVQDIGKDAYHVTVEVFRNEPDSQTKYELFTSKKDHVLSKEVAFNHANFPISVQSNELEVIITWQEKPSRLLKDGQKDCESERKYKQTFTFKD